MNDTIDLHVEKLAVQFRGRVNPLLLSAHEKFLFQMECFRGFYSDALRKNQMRIRIVHGSGTGKLKSEIRKFLSEQSEVKDIRDGFPYEGGEGMTIITFRVR